MYQARESVLHISGGDVNCAMFGSGSRPLVLIPGLSLREVKGSAEMLAHMYRVFNRDFRTYVFDRKSGIPDGYTVEQMADDVAECMKKLSIKEADVIGISQGGMIAQYLAIHYPQMVRRMVLGVTCSRPDANLKEVIGRWVDFAGKGDYRSVLEDMLPVIYSEKYQKKYGRLFPTILKIVKVIPPERFVIHAKACLTCDTYERLSEIRCPVFVIGGEKDRLVGAEASREIAQKLNCEIYMYEELGHSAYEEAKDFNQRMYRFLIN